MAIPSITQTIRDPGLPNTPTAITSFLFLGTAQFGPTNAIQAFSNPADVIDTFGQGPLSEDLCYYLAIAGGPAYGLRLTGSTAATSGSVTATRVGTSTGVVSLTGTPLDSYSGMVLITGDGTRGTAKFRFSMDAGKSWSNDYLVPSGGSFTTAFGLTIGFTAASYEESDVFTFTTTEARYSASDLSTGMDVVKADNSPYAAIILSGTFGTASAAATIAAAMSVHASALFQLYRPIRWMQDAGADTTSQTKTDFTAFVSDRASICYGRSTCYSGKPMEGRSFPSCSIVRPLAGRAGASLFSTDLAWFSAGPLPGVTAITHNEYLQELMDIAGFTTLRTHQGEPGFYATNVRLKSQSGSDYQYWQHGRVMDVATTTAYRSLLPFLSSSVRTITGGKIDPRDAGAWEASVYDAERTVLLDPDNAQGTQGHASAVEAKIDRTTNVLTSGVVKVKVAVQPLGYTKYIQNELSFSANVGG